MANLLSTTVNGSLLALNNGETNAYSTASNGRLYLGSSAQDDYSIYTHLENFGGNYTKLTLDWHTGIKIGASQGYGGIRFYNDSINRGGVKLFSIGEGDSHVRVENNLYVGNTIYNNGNAVIHAGNIGSQSVSYATNSGSLDGYDYSQFTGVLARYITTAGGSARIRITAPFSTNSSKMFSVDINMYAGYTQYKYTVSGYMYGSINQWYEPRAVFTGTGTPDIYVGRDNSGRAYISIANGNYTGIVVNNFVSGYVASEADAYIPWSITLDSGNENSVGVGVVTTITSANIGAQSVSYAASAGVVGTADYAVTAGDADTVDGFHKEAFPYRSSGTSGYYQVADWMQFNTTAGIYWPNYNGAHIYANTTGSYGSIRIDGSRNGWEGIYFNSGATLMMNASNVGIFRHNVGWYFEWTNGSLIVYKGAGGGGTAATVIDSSTIGSQTVGQVNQTSHIRPAILLNASGTTDAGGSLGMQQMTGEGWTGIFVDYEPHTGWGLWHDNPNNYFSFTAEASTGSIRSFTVPSRESGNRTAYEKFRIDQASGDVIVGRDGYAQSSFRAPIFYDSQDTGYFLDPNADLSLRVYGEICNSNYAEGKMQPGALNIGRIDTNYAWDGSSWASDVRLGLLANTSETWEFGIHDSNDSVMSVVLFDGGSTLTMGRNLGWGECVVNAPAGYVSNGNPWGTANSAFFPNGVTTADKTNWLYGHNYIGNAPSNGGGVEINSTGRIYSRVSSVSQDNGYAGRFLDRNNAATNYIPYSFEEDFGNHSWGQVARFHIWNNGGSDRPSIQFSSGYSNTRWNVGYCYNDDNFRITQNMGYRPDGSGTYDNWGTERFRINTDGSMYCFSSFTASGDVTAYSDIRVKDNIETITNAIDKVKSIRGVTFTRTDNDDNKKYMGVIAQELLNVIPEVVSETDSGMYTVAYGNITAVLIEAIKEQQKQIDELKAKIDGITN